MGLTVTTFTDSKQKKEMQPRFIRLVIDQFESLQINRIGKFQFGRTMPPLTELVQINGKRGKGT